MIPGLLAALDSEVGEFVRPAVVRTLAAQGTDARVQPVLVRDVGRGQTGGNGLPRVQAALGFQHDLVGVPGDRIARLVAGVGDLEDERALDPAQQVDVRGGTELLQLTKVVKP